MSDMTYWKNGSTLYVYFPVWDAGAGKTGLVDGDFTKLVRKDGTTVVATTGITVAEVDDTNFPGRYVATVNGSTGFIATNGQYEMLVYWSSQTSADGHVANITVTNDGTGSASWGTALFTAALSDGRVTDGSSAIEDATVYVYNASGVLLYRTQTDASGLWSTNFDSDGTYSIYVQQSSYSIGTATVVVSGGTATGPGADIALSALSSSTGYTFSALKAYALRQWFDKSDTQADTMAGEAVNEAVRFVATSRNWKWYNRMVTIDLQPPYSTGTIAITSGAATVTLTGGTFPSWAASGVILYGGQVYEVSTRDSDTQLTLSENWPGASLTASSYTLAQYAYALPSSGVYSIMKVLGGNGWPYPVEPISYASWATLRDQFPTGGGPYSWTIFQGKIAVWPYYTGSNAVRYNLHVKAKPTSLVSGTDEADWDPSLPDILYRAIDLHISYRGRCRAGDTQVCNANFDAAMARAVGNDQEQTIDINRKGTSTTFTEIDLATRSVV
jgi:hypothetical protein